MREIHTGLYGEYAETILNNVKQYCRTYGLKLDCKSFRLVEFERGVDNEIMLSVFDDLYNVALRKTVFRAGAKNDMQIRAWLAGCVKGLAKKGLSAAIVDIHKAAIAKTDGWSRTNDAMVRAPECVDAPVAAYYAVYETLKGRKIAKAKFPGDVFDKTVGQPFDPVRVELETYRREETSKIHAGLADEIARLDKECQAEVDRIRAKFDDIKSEARQKAEAEERRLNYEIAEALNAA